MEDHCYVFLFLSPEISAVPSTVITSTPGGSGALGIGEPAPGSVGSNSHNHLVSQGTSLPWFFRLKKKNVFKSKFEISHRSNRSKLHWTFCCIRSLTWKENFTRMWEIL